jgi:hypothetical protein
LVSDIPAGNGKKDKLFYSVVEKKMQTFWEHGISFSRHFKGFDFVALTVLFNFLPFLPVLEFLNNLWGLGT